MGAKLKEKRAAASSSSSRSFPPKFPREGERKRERFPDPVVCNLGDVHGEWKEVSGIDCFSGFFFFSDRLMVVGEREFVRRVLFVDDSVLMERSFFVTG